MVRIPLASIEATVGVPGAYSMGVKAQGVGVGLLSTIAPAAVQGKERLSIELSAHFFSVCVPGAGVASAVPAFGVVINADGNEWTFVEIPAASVGARGGAAA